MKPPRTPIKPPPAARAAKPRPRVARPEYGPLTPDLRRQAEARLRNLRQDYRATAGIPDAGAPDHKADPRRLVHELQVHQIELELQNAELQAARDRMEVLVDQYTDLYDFAPVGYFTLAADGTILQVNLTGTRLVGIERSHLVGLLFGMLIPREMRPALHSFIEKVFEGQVRRSGDFELLVKGQPSLAVRIEAQCSPDGRECRAVVVDIRERKRAELILHANEALFSALIEHAPIGIYVVDAQFCLRQVNPVAMVVFSPVHPLIGRGFSEVHHLLWPNPASDKIVARFRHTLKTGEPYRSPDYSIARVDNMEARRIYEWQIHRITLPDSEQAVVCFFKDITERKEAEQAQRRIDVLSASNRKLEQEIVQRRAVENALRLSEQRQTRLLEESQRQQKQLQRLPRQILSAQEEERKRISRELHDVVAQTLTSINLSLAQLKVEPGTNTRNFDRKLSQAQSLLREAVDTVHQFARELRPTVLDDLGLIPALHTFMRDFTTQTGIRTELKVAAAVDQLEPVRRTVLFRVIQEALNNVAHHAGASHVKVSLLTAADGISLTIWNDGKAFDVARALNFTIGKRLGLLGMRERLEMVGGCLALESTPDQGTTVTAKIPPDELPMGKIPPPSISTSFP